MSDEAQHEPCPHCGRGIQKVWRAYVLIDPADLSVYEAYAWNGDPKNTSNHAIEDALLYEGEIHITSKRLKVND